MTRLVLAHLLFLCPTLVTAQPAADAAGVPRTAWGAPDLQGVWDFRSITPMERPQELADTEFLTAAEAAALEQEAAHRNALLLNRPARRTKVTDDVESGEDGAPGFYNNFWLDWGTRTVVTRRTALVVDPRDGKIPSLTPAAEEKQAAAAETRRGLAMHQPTPGGWIEDLGANGLQVRCIAGFNSGPPMTPSGFNSYVQLFQTPEYVVLLNELNHNWRIVSLAGRAHNDLRQWTGDSRGSWDGETLIVETTSFLRETSFLLGQTDAHLRLVERFTRTSPQTLLYEATIHDATVWSRPWTFQIPMQRSDQPIYESACHEGNYSLHNILAGARAVEAAAAAETRRTR